jgi:hypothetical protein
MNKLVLGFIFIAFVLGHAPAQSAESEQFKFVFEVVDDSPFIVRREIDRDKLGLEGQGPGFVNAGGGAGFLLQLALQAAVNTEQKRAQIEAADQEARQAVAEFSKELAGVKPNALILESLQASGRGWVNAAKLSVVQEVWVSSDYKGVRLSVSSKGANGKGFHLTAIRTVPAPLILPDGGFNPQFSAKKVLRSLYQDIHDLYAVWSRENPLERRPERTIRYKYGGAVVYERGSLLVDWCYRHAFMGLTGVATLAPKDSETDDSNLCEAVVSP